MVALNNDSDDDDEGEQKKKFVAAITDVVQRLLREGEGKRRGSVKPETFQALQVRKGERRSRVGLRGRAEGRDSSFETQP